MKEAFQDAKKAPVTALGGSVEVVTRAELAGCRHWAHAFSNERKDHRYYELVEDTIHQGFDYRYFVIKDATGEVCAIQPFFLLEQDLLAGIAGPVTAAADFVRRWWPGFMQMRTLMVGCTAGEGHLDRIDEMSHRRDAELLADTIKKHAHDLKARLIVMKEFPATYRTSMECFVNDGFTRVPSLPMVDLNIDYADFDDYMMRGLPRRMRNDLRRKFRDAAHAAPIELSVVTDATPIIDDIYPLYLQVYEKSSLHFEKLTKEYFCRIGRLMPDKARFFVWRQSGKIIGFSLVLVQGDAIYSEYLGLDYSVALRVHLYFYAFRDTVAWAIANGYKRYLSTGLNYDPKRNLRFQLYPLDLYVRHTSRIFNVVLARLLPLIEPTRYDKTLPRFANYHELWDNGPPPQSIDVIPSRMEEKEVA
ncbi:MAG TPA: GNAT family N-acetyltransferase [Pseudorhodoplanes sp.]|nr:GNAT family N-acetyltransferase [Pseudorhodoplanes sp.]